MPMFPLEMVEREAQVVALYYRTLRRESIAQDEALDIIERVIETYARLAAERARPQP